MKLLFLLACSVMLCTASFAQGTPQPADPDGEALIGKSKAILDAVKNKDVAALDGLLADNFHSVDVAGDVDSRQEMLGSAREGFMKDFLFYSPQAFRIDDDSMIVSYRTAITLSDAALKELAEDNITWPRYSEVSDLWVRQGNDWKLKFEQTTPVRAMY
jgi:hypothetical protein